MNCLCCGKTLKNDDGTGWHKACVKRFFTTTKLPDIDIDDQKLKVLAEESINKGYTVPGVQKKLSLHLLSELGNPRLTLVNYPTGKSSGLLSICCTRYLPMIIAFYIGKLPNRIYT